jgi:tetratricopeptide (TPR) repeat protein
MMGKTRFQALKARNSKAQGEGCEAAETLGVTGRNEKPCKGETDRCVALTGIIWGYPNTQGLRPGLCCFALSALKTLTRTSNCTLKAACILCAVSVLMLLGNCTASGNAGADNYSQGRVALRSGDYGKAKRCFDSALSEKNNLEGSQAGLLQTLRETGSYQEALKRAQGFLSAQNNSALQLEQGRILEETGEYASAEISLRQSLALARAGSTIRLEALRELGELLEETGRRKDAAVAWNQILDEYRAGRVQGSQSLGNVAVAAWRRGFVRDAQDIFLDATDPKNGEVSLESLADFGYLFLEKYNATDALGVFRDCLKINKTYPRALLGIALAKKYEDDFEVEAYARAALAVNPNLTDALNVLAELRIEEEDYKAALLQIDSALAINPANLESLSLQAFCLYSRGDRPGFSKIEKQVLAINPVCGKFYYVLADNLVSRRKYQEAVDWSRKAIALDPELWPAHATLGMNLTRIGDLDGGRKAIQQAFDGDPFNVWAFNSLELFDQMDTFARSRSEHFVFRMSKEDMPALSSYAPELAEEVYAKLTQRYGFKPNGPLQVEVFPDHGGFAVRTLGLPGLSGALGVCFGKVVAIDSPRARKTGSFNWGSTLWHEFTHVITLQMTDYNIPRWYSEGLSVYEEHRAHPGWGDNLTSAFLEAYKAGKLMKASELNAGFLHPQNPGQIMFAYYQAALVCEMIDEKYGFDKIRQSLLFFAENKPAEEVFRETLGLNAAQMDAEYAKYLDSRFKEISLHIDLPGSEKAPGEEIAGAPNKDVLMRQVKNAPDYFWANLRLGGLLRKEGANSEAEGYLKKAQQLFPQYVEAGNPYQLLGEMYLESKRQDDALAQFTTWSRLDGDSAEPLLKAAEIYRSRKDWNSAAKMLNLSIFINPYDSEVQKMLGEAAMESGQWPVALAAYRTMVGLDTSNPADAHYDLARALLASGNRQEAKREILRSLEIAPTFRKAQELLLKLSGETNEN